MPFVEKMTLLKSTRNSKQKKQLNYVFIPYMPSLNSSAALFIILSRSNAASLFGLAVVSSYVNVNLYEQYPEDNT